MIGMIAACLTTLFFVPQAIQVIKTKDTSGISLIMLFYVCYRCFLWFIHGMQIGDYAVIVANGITFILASIILCYKVKYK